MSETMPADLKLKEVARDIICEYVTATNGAHCTAQFSEAEQIVESRLQTLVSEVRAQAMEEAAKIADHETGYQSQYAHGIAREPMRAMGHIIAEAIRRRASGKDEE
jgi:hypothetical protein